MVSLMSRELDRVCNDFAPLLLLFNVQDCILSEKSSRNEKGKVLHTTTLPLLARVLSKSPSYLYFPSYSPLARV